MSNLPWTPYGFAWGPVLVTRMFERIRKDHGKRRGNYWLRVSTGHVIPDDSKGARIDAPHHHVDIRVSDQGRNVVVYLDDVRLGPLA